VKGDRRKLTSIRDGERWARKTAAAEARLHAPVVKELIWGWGVGLGLFARAPVLGIGFFVSAIEIDERERRRRPRQGSTHLLEKGIIRS